MVLQQLLRLLGAGQLESLSRRTTQFLNEVNREIRRKTSSGKVIDGIINFDGSKTLTSFVSEDRPPWSTIPIERSGIPGMILDEEIQYYHYIGQFYSGRGAVVELGPWLGCSTVAIIGGLIGNPHFAGRKLHVYDDFVWRTDWMSKYVPEHERLEHHRDFQFLFENYTREIADHLIVEKRKIIDYDGNERLPKLVWTGGPIEMIYADCGRTFAANQGWYEIFEPSFLSGRTFLILQDWGTHSEVPVRWYNQMKQFVDSKGSKLQLVHELKNGHIATFIYH